MISKEAIRLSIALAKAEFKLKNEGSYLGFIWYLLNPLLMSLLLIAVFSNNLGATINHYPLYLILGIILFNFFRNITQESTKSIYDHRFIIKSINFPIESLIASNIIKSFLSHIFEIIIFSLLMTFFGLSFLNILTYPLVLIFFILFIYGISLILASLNSYFMDLENIWLFVSQLIWFATPIFYSVENQPVLYHVNLYNPLFYFIDISRDILIYHQQPETWMLLNMIGFSLITLLIGTLIFNKLKHNFSNLI